MTLRELSKELQNGWVERLFSRLSAMYGAAFGRQWEGTNLPDVKSVWAEKLGGFNAAQIGAALNSCDERPYPPNLPEFIDLCRQVARRQGGSSAQPQAPQLSGQERIERSEQLAKAAAKDEGYDWRGWANHLKSEYLAGVCLHPMQIEMASSAMGELWNKRVCVRA